MSGDFTLLTQHWEFLHERAVADDVAAERGYRSAIRKSDLANLGFGRTQQLIPALVIPVHSIRAAIETYQLRPDTPRLNEKGKPRKYEQKAGARMLLDAHPRLTRPRDRAKVPLIADPTVPLFITEGIAKADSAVSIGLCCIALLGVWNFRGSNETGGKTAVADWELIALNGRAVYIAFDSDVMEKRAVYAALARLKGFLESRKAAVKVIYLPVGEHGEKVGLDDFIAQQKSAGKSDPEICGALLALATNELRRPAADSASSKDGSDARPSITLQPGKLPEIVDGAEKVLVANAERLKLFQRAGEIVRIISLTHKEVAQANKHDGLERPDGAVVLHSVTATALLEIFDRLLVWQVIGAEGEAKPKDCPGKISSIYLSRVGFWKLPHLVGVIEAPMLRPDGTVLNIPGYDRETGLFLNSAEAWPEIPPNPTRSEAEAALRILIAPFSEFPFGTDEDKSVLLAGILTALQRRLLKSAPLFGFSAPSQRSGKSLLVESIGIIATGRMPAAAGVSRETEELRKAITATLREGHLMAHLDNITHPLDSPDLARAITQSVYSDRLLGTNTTLRLPTNVLWTATGNNLTFKGDMASRALLCRIDAQMEHPEERGFSIGDLHAHLVENRKRLVMAALTTLRAYHVAGRPKQNVKPWGGFDHWSREIREPLVWLGLPDPCATRERIVVNDPERELTVEVLRAWLSAFDDRVMLVREIVAAAQDGEHDELMQALLTVAAKRDDSKEIDARRLGAWCSSKAGRIIDGLRLTPDRKIRRAQRWRVSCVSSVSSKPADENGQARTHSDAVGGQATESVCASPSSDRPELNSPNSPDSPVVDSEDF